MNQQRVQAIALPHGAESALAGNRVIRNTYMLLSMTMFAAAATAGLSVALKLPHPGIIITLVGYFGLLFGISRMRNSGWGVALVFALTAFMGYTLGPIISHYLSLPNGGQTVMMAMGGTAAIFFEVPALSLTVSPAFVLLMSGLILYETSNIIHGGETNYVMATVSLFVSIFNLFTSLLHLLGFASSGD